MTAGAVKEVAGKRARDRVTAGEVKEGVNRTDGGASSYPHEGGPDGSGCSAWTHGSTEALMAYVGWVLLHANYQILRSGG